MKRKKNGLTGTTLHSWTCFALIWAFPVVNEAGTNAPNRPDLTGTILETGGLPLPDATVFIYTAAPRTGSSTLCPYCYLDCTKRGTTDSRGQFKIEALSPDLVFRILAVAKDHKPEFKGKVDPLRGPVTLQLEKLNLAGLGPKQSLRGRVVDPAGKPIFGAVVNFEFFSGEEANCGGDCDGVDHIAVTDHEGNFLIAAEKKFDWMTVTAEARGLAKRKFFKLASTNSHELSLAEGVAVSGRIVKGGRPLKGVRAGLVSQDRSENFTGKFEIATDAEGKFQFVNIPPYQQYYVYALMDSVKKAGCVPVKRIRVAADGTTRDVGDLPVVPGLTLTGRAVLSDGKPLPASTRVLISREGAWDSQSVEVNADGRFIAMGLPPESYGISLRVPGYYISPKNSSLDRMNGGRLIGLIESNTDVVILLEPGEFKRPDFSHGIPAGEIFQPKDQPLRGAANL